MSLFCFSLIQSFDGTKLFYVNSYTNSKRLPDFSHILVNFIFGFTVTVFTVLSFYFLGNLANISTVILLIISGSLSISMTPMLSMIEAKGKVFLSSLYRGLFISSTYVLILCYFFITDSLAGSEYLFLFSLSVYVVLLLFSNNDNINSFFNRRPSLKQLRDGFSHISSYVQFNFLGVLTGYVERFALATLVGGSSLGVFNAQAEVYQRANLVYRVLAAVVNPRLALLRANFNVTDIGFELAIFLSAATSIGVITLNYYVEPLLVFLFSENFVNFSISFKVGLCLLVFSSVNYISAILFALDENFQIQKNNYFYSLLVFCPSVALLTYFYGFYGFAISLFTVRISDLLNIYILSKKSLNNRYRYLYVLLSLSIISAVFTLSFSSTILLLGVSLGVLVYSCVLLFNRYSEVRNELVL